jgi:hypothetical protein
MVSVERTKAKKIAEFLAWVALLARVGGASGGPPLGKTGQLGREATALRARLLQTDAKTVSRATMQKIEQFNRMFEGIGTRPGHKKILLKKMRSTAYAKLSATGPALVASKGAAAAAALRRGKETRSVRRRRK